MKKSVIYTIGFIVYSLVLMCTFFQFGKYSYAVNNQDNNYPPEVTAGTEEQYIAKEEEGKLHLYKDGEIIMSLDTNVEMLPTIVRSQLKNGVEFKLSDLPLIIEAFAE